MLILEQCIWAAAAKAILAFVHFCLACQKVKTQRHIQSPLITYENEADRPFAHLNIDLVGPLPTSEGYRLCLTIIDRYSRWPLAIPIVDSTAPVVADAFVKHWISQYGVLKFAIKCYALKNCTKVLPIIILGLRTTVKLDIGTSPAEMLYGTQLRIPTEFWIENTKQDFVKHLRQAMNHQHSSKPL